MVSRPAANLAQPVNSQCQGSGSDPSASAQAGCTQPNRGAFCFIQLVRRGAELVHATAQVEGVAEAVLAAPGRRRPLAPWRLDRDLLVVGAVGVGDAQRLAVGLLVGGAERVEGRGCTRSQRLARRRRAARRGRCAGRVRSGRSARCCCRPCPGQGGTAEAAPTRSVARAGGGRLGGAGVGVRDVATRRRSCSTAGGAVGPGDASSLDLADDRRARRPWPPNPPPRTRCPGPSAPSAGCSACARDRSRRRRGCAAEEDAEAHRGDEGQPDRAPGGESGEEGHAMLRGTECMAGRPPRSMRNVSSPSPCDGTTRRRSRALTRENSPRHATDMRRIAPRSRRSGALRPIQSRATGPPDQCSQLPQE